jgi:hypothetical protein
MLDTKDIVDYIHTTMSLAEAQNQRIASLAKKADEAIALADTHKLELDKVALEKHALEGRVALVDTLLSALGVSSLEAAISKAAGETRFKPCVSTLGCVSNYDTRHHSGDKKAPPMPHFKRGVF